MALRRAAGLLAQRVPQLGASASSGLECASPYALQQLESSILSPSALQA